jgi:hypothetical protein
MTYKYLYIDDTKNQIEQGTINGIEDGGEIKVQFRFPDNWEVLLNELQGTLSNFNGLILDLRLNDNPYKDGKYAFYRGTSVAQELRTLAKEHVFKEDFPIVLISANENIEKSLDPTSFDLFDYLIRKDNIGNERGISYAEFRTKLKWLADGYDYLNNVPKDIRTILQVPPKVVLDERFVDHFNKLLDTPIVHVIAKFISKETILKPSFLINKEYVQARLGLDKQSDDWELFEERYLAQARYTGAFSKNCQRWWQSLIEQFWSENISSEVSLRNLSAEERVLLIKEKTGLKNLVPIEKDEKSRSESFWVVCKATGISIDTIDGFTIAGQENNYPWQEREFICIKEALRPTKFLSVASFEKPRLQKLKDLFEKYEQRVRK